MFLFSFSLLSAHAMPGGVLLLGSSHIAVSDLERQTGTALQAAPGWETTVGKRLNGPGYTLSTHLELYQTGDPKWFETLDQEWRAISFQQSSHEVGLDQASATWIEGRDAAVALADIARADGAMPVLMLSWANVEGSDVDPERYPDYDTMQDLVTEGYLAYHAAMERPGEPVYIVPVGVIFQWIGDNWGRKDLERLYAPDGSHPAFEGTSLAAATFFAVYTGRDPNEYDLGLDPKTIWPLPAVTEFVLDDPWGPYPYPFAREWDGVDGQPVVIDFDGSVRPSVRLLAAAAVPSVDVLDGRLFLFDGADLATDALVLEGELRMHAGARLAATTVTGSLTLDAGTLAGASSITGDLEVAAEATIQLASGEGLEVGGAALVQGPLVVTGEWGPGTHPLLTATTLDWQGEVELPVGLGDAEVQVDAASVVLVVPEPPEPPDPPTEPTVPGDDDDVGDPVAPEPDEDPAAAGCGCATGAPGVGVALLPLALALGRRRAR